MNPLVIALAMGAIKGLANSGSRKRDKAKKANENILLQQQIDQQKLYNDLVTRYLNQQGYNQVYGQNQNYTPTYKVTGDILNDLNRRVYGNYR